MINSQQIMLLLPLFNVSPPAIFLLIYKPLMSMLNFEIYNFGEDINEWLEIGTKKADDKMQEKLDFIKVESISFIENMGEFILWGLIYLVPSLLVFVLIILFPDSQLI